MNTQHFGKFIKDLRSSKAWTQEQLAAVADLSVRTVQRIEGEEVAPSAETLMALANAFDMDVQQLRTLAAAKDLSPEQEEELKKALKDIEFIPRIRHGHELVALLQNAHLSVMRHDPLDDDEEAKLVGGFLEGTRDWGNCLDDIGPSGRAEAEVSLTRDLEELEESGFWVFGKCHTRKYSISRGIDAENWTLIFLLVVRVKNPTILNCGGDKVFLPANVQLDSFSLSPT